jgi:hypothetical protein
VVQVIVQDGGQRCSLSRFDKRVHYRPGIMLLISDNVTRIGGAATTLFSSNVSGQHPTYYHLITRQWRPPLENEQGDCLKPHDAATAVRAAQGASDSRLPRAAVRPGRLGLFRFALACVGAVVVLGASANDGRQGNALNFIGAVGRAPLDSTYERARRVCKAGVSRSAASSNTETPQSRASPRP